MNKPFLDSVANVDIVCFSIALVASDFNNVVVLCEVFGVLTVNVWVGVKTIATKIIDPLELILFVIALPQLIALIVL